MTKLHELITIGQAVWIDYIRRSFTLDGKLLDMVENGVRGVTSNPTIFDKAISGSEDYDSDIHQFAEFGKSTMEIYELLVIKDIRDAAEVLLPLYRQTDAVDGYVSLEVNPTLAHDTQGTISEAKRLFDRVNHPNVMIKIPATPAGIPAIEETIANGINVNVTLIFSLVQYEAVVNAYISGLERRFSLGQSIYNIASVASFFVSRVDTAVDTELKKKERHDLCGKIAVDNARLAYIRFGEQFNTDQWRRLQQAGARVQRPLWASTGTKNPDYADTLYIDSLIGKNTVNTVPPATLDAFLEHGKVALTIGRDTQDAFFRIHELNKIGVDFEAITDKLLEEGVAAFADSFDSLLNSVNKKKTKLLAQ
jgi:transaldolase